MSTTVHERDGLPEPNGARYAIGAAYGTASVRAVVVDVAGGAEVGTGTYEYERGTGGVIVSAADPHLARQDPQDYVDGFHSSVAEAVRQARENVGLRAESVVGIGVDATGSPPELRADGPHAGLTAAAERLRPGESGLLALDWNSGNRTVLVDHRLTGLLLGQTLHTTAPEVYRSLVEATAFGARKIVDRLESFGVPVKDIVVCGGISRKSSFILGIYADVLNRPIHVASAVEVCAVGAAMFGAVSAGAYVSIEAAQEGMTHGADATFAPDPARAAVYDRLYGLYGRLHDAFGGVSTNGDMGSVMKELIAIREEATA